MLKKFFILTALYLLHSTSYAQISHGGQPEKFSLSSSLKIAQKSSASWKKMPALLESDKKINLDKNSPLQFAHPFKVNYTPENSGTWSVMGDKNIWRLIIESSGAYSINLIFSKFNLPVEGRLFIYNADQSSVLGSFTHENASKSGTLAVAPIEGDIVVVEYQQPIAIKTKPEIQISQVSHDYLGILKAGIGFKASGSCNTNITCYETSGEIVQKRAVCQLVIDGTMRCSGALISNSQKNNTPYLLTAGHCLINKEASAPNIVATFNYESPNCFNTIEGSKLQSLTGTTVKVWNDTLDVALLQFDTTPPDYYRPYYSGWNLSATPPTPLTVIHHPSADVKKKALSESTPVEYSYTVTNSFGNVFEPNAHWWIAAWKEGTTEGGSSGSPLFDNNGLIIGSLTGGNASCTNSTDDFFARLNVAWDFTADVNGKVKTYLDNSGTATTLIGYDPYFPNSYKRINNLESSEQLALPQLSTPESGYWSGHNSLGYTAFAEHFPHISSAVLRGVYLIPGNYTASSTQKVVVKVWQDNGAEPSTVLWESAPIEIKTLKSNREAYIDFGAELAITTPIYVGYEIEYQSTVESFAVYMTAQNLTRTRNNMVVRDGTTWKELSVVNNDYLAGGSLMIDLLAKNVIYLDTSVYDKPVKEFILYPNPTKGYVAIKGVDEPVESFKLFDMTGRLVFNTQPTTTIVEIPDQIDGLFIVDVKTATVNYRSKLMILK